MSIKHDPEVQTMSRRLSDKRSFRWLPRHGRPMKIGEWILQSIVRFVAWLPVYTAIVVTAVLLILIFGVPFVGESGFR